MSVREPMTVETKQEFIAALLHNNLVASSDVPQDMVTSIFMPLMFMDEAFVEKLKEIQFVYSIIGKHAVAPRSVNGWPVFFSMSIMYKDDWETFKFKVFETIEARNKILENAGE